MQVKHFSIKDALKFGFKKSYEHFGLIISTALLFFVSLLIVPLLLSLAMLLDPDSSSIFLFLPLNIKIALGFILGIAIIAVICVLLTFMQGVRRIMLDIYDQNSSSPQRLVSQVSIFVTLMIVNVLYGAMVQIGLIFFILPGLYLSAKYGFYNYCLVDDNTLGPIEALKRSGQLTKGVVNYICLYNLIWIFLYWISLVTLVGWIIIIPSLFLSDAYIYRKLTKQTDEPEIFNFEIHN